MSNKLKSKQDLENLRKEILRTKEKERSLPLITICNGTGCHATGCVGVLKAFRQEIESQGLVNKVNIKATGCHGFCERGPIVVIQPGDIFYQWAKTEDVPQIVKETVIQGNIIDRLLYVDSSNGKKYVHPSEVP